MTGHDARVILTEGVLRFAQTRMRDGQRCAVIGSPVGIVGGCQELLAIKLVLPATKEISAERLAAMHERWDQKDRAVVGVLSFSGSDGSRGVCFSAENNSDVRILRDGVLTCGGQQGS